MSSECEVIRKTGEGVIGHGRAMAEPVLPLLLIPYDSNVRTSKRTYFRWCLKISPRFYA